MWATLLCDGDDLIRGMTGIPSDEFDESGKTQSGGAE